MPTAQKTIAIVNGTGRQAASLITVAVALGYCVRVQIYKRLGLIAEELFKLPDDQVTIFEGPLLNNPNLIDELFKGAQLAFINTTSQAGDEVVIGKALADAAKKTGRIQHYIYSSMPDHSIHNPAWPGLPMWSCKFTVENYIRQLDLPATFVYAGIYNNNFTSLPYPLFCMELQADGSFIWRAPFHPDIELPWLDAEHDVGPAVMQLFKDGPAKWNGHRIALAFEMLTPKAVCEAFSRALNRPCTYIRYRNIQIRVSIPAGYREQLEGIALLFGQYEAPYLPGPEFGQTSNTSSPTSVQARSRRGNRANESLVDEARALWEGWRGMEEYAREVFPVEEEANGLEWMKEGFESSATTPQTEFWLNGGGGEEARTI